MRTFNFAVELRCAAFDVRVADAKIFNVPMELRLEFMAVIGSDLTDAERELFDDVIREVDGIGLSMFFVDFQGPHPRCIIDSGILKTAHLFTLFSFEGQELNIHLNVMARNLLLVSFGVDLAHAGPARKTVHPMPPQDA